MPKKTTKQNLSLRRELGRKGRPHANDPRPGGRSPKVQAAVPEYDRERLRAAAQVEGIPETDIVRMALSYFLDLIEKKKINLRDLI